MHDYTTRQINTPEGRWVLWSLESRGTDAVCCRRPAVEDRAGLHGDIARGITQPL